MLSYLILEIISSSTFNFEKPTRVPPIIRPKTNNSSTILFLIIWKKCLLPKNSSK